MKAVSLKVMVALLAGLLAGCGDADEDGRPAEQHTPASTSETDPGGNVQPAWGLPEPLPHHDPMAAIVLAWLKAIREDDFEAFKKVSLVGTVESWPESKREQTFSEQKEWVFEVLGKDFDFARIGVAFEPNLVGKDLSDVRNVLLYVLVDGVPTLQSVNLVKDKNGARKVNH